MKGPGTVNYYLKCVAFACTISPLFMKFNQLFAMLLEVILGKNRSNFNHRHLLLHFLEGNVIIYHVIAYDPKSEKNVRKLYFGCHGNQFLQFKVIFRKDPKTVWQFFIDSDNKKRTYFN